jgi:hypothetical protein
MIEKSFVYVYDHKMTSYWKNGCYWSDQKSDEQVFCALRHCEKMTKKID